MTPQQIQTQFRQALALIQSGEAAKAGALLKSLLLPTGGAPEIEFQLARVAELQGETEAQAAALNRALARKPQEPTILQAAIVAETRLGHHGRVLDLHDRLIALAPKEIKPKADKALFLQNIGEFDAAGKLLKKLIRQHPTQTELYRMLSAGHRFAKGDPLIRQMQGLWTNPRLNDVGKMQIGFALAKSAEDTGDRDRVFSYLKPANAAQGRLFPFNAAERDAEWQAFRDAQDGADYAPVGDPLPLRPVFVTGLPRSGTTLVEQIIAAHSGARAGGEMRYALQEAVAQFGPAAKMVPLKELSEAKLSGWAEAYQRFLRRDTGPQPGVVTDKAIQNHLIFGLIARALPGARIIVVHRDPRDQALSVYKNHFAQGTHRYANDLGDIARTIKAFRANIAFWKERLGDRIHEIRYDDLVADPEPQARALIAAAGLDWEAACLAFHEVKSEVKTLSLAQVRQPIHAGRREAWRKYETEMAPFFDAWGDEPWD
ncbi:tetratricopeptide repeat-containing sulfotransferase family protein [Antarctobacter jejuensis]|uniref:tetratricopeptide repeat-containing sulfotransferase family protein n=1 Tax=Antarctobacter jejuensis TaxID=1439938 RepID=UPI003FD2CB00